MRLGKRVDSDADDASGRGRGSRAPSRTSGRRNAMPMPHRTFAEVAKRRLVGKEGRERVATIRALLGELPGVPERTLRRPAQVARGRARPDAGAREGRPPRLDPGAPRGCGADRARRAAERRQVVAAAGALVDPDQDGRLRLHDAATRPGADADRRRPRPARRDPGADRRRARGPRRRPGAARRAPQRGRDRLLPRGRRAARALDGRAREVAAAGIEKPAIVALTKADEAA